MSSWLRPWARGVARPKRSSRLHSYRPVLEALEDRCLLSGGYLQTNLAADVPGLAPVTDANLINPWGISASPGSPFWLAENSTGASELLNANGQVQPLVVTIPSVGPGGSDPTGTVFNSGTGFAIAEHGIRAPSSFLFATEQGTLAGWNPTVNLDQAIVTVDNSASGAIYKGLALAVTSNGQSLLYAANFAAGTVDVFNQHFQAVTLPGGFQDSTLPAGFAPFNIQNINGLLFVAYAKQGPGNYDALPGAGNGFIDVYQPNGTLVERFASGGPLNSPWGMALAPAGFGQFSGDLLVGNNGDGHINAYDLTSGAYLGTLTDTTGAPLAIDGLWGLSFGTSPQGTPANTLFFAAGPDQEQHGLFGEIQDPNVPLIPTNTGSVTYDPSAPDDNYPLPPAAGPTLRPGSADSLPPTAVLLPMSGSALALVPTLSTVQDQGARSDAAASAIRLASTTTPPVVAIPSLYQPELSGSVQQHAVVSLSAFLDLGASLNHAEGSPPGQDLNPAVFAIAERASFLEETGQRREDLNETSQPQWSAVEGVNPLVPTRTEGEVLHGASGQETLQGPALPGQESASANGNLERPARQEEVAGVAGAGWQRLPLAAVAISGISLAWDRMRRPRSQHKESSVRPGNSERSTIFTFWTGLFRRS